MTPFRLCVLAPLVLAAGCARTTVVTPAPEPQRRGNSTTVHVLGIPPGQLPRAGQCRVWVPGTPPGRQPRARSCVGIARLAPAGSWILFRPATSRIVHVHVMDRSKVGDVTLVRFYNEDGTWVRDEQPGAHRDTDEDDGGRGRGRRRT